MAFPDSAVLIIDEDVLIAVLLVSEEHTFRVADFEPTEQSSGTLQSLLFHDIVINLR